MCVKKYAEKYKTQMYLVFRVLVGGMFFLHGAQKVGLIGSGSVSAFATSMGLGMFVAYLVAYGELLGGLAILLGFYTRLAALGGTIITLGAYVTVHLGWNPLASKGELSLMYVAAFLVLMIYGAQKYSVEKAVTEKEKF